MEKVYEVFSKHMQPAQAEVTLPDGAKVMATVDAMKIQLVPYDVESSTVTLCFTNPTDIAAADEKFVVGENCIMNF